LVVLWDDGRVDVGFQIDQLPTSVCSFSLYSFKAFDRKVSLGFWVCHYLNPFSIFNAWNGIPLSKIVLALA